ncbi:hypothetical protein V8C35DRAFT_80986 [Trichoderma chlorosporum]
MREQRRRQEKRQPRYWQVGEIDGAGERQAGDESSGLSFFFFFFCFFFPCSLQRHDGLSVSVSFFLFLSPLLFLFLSLFPRSRIPPCLCQRPASSPPFVPNSSFFSQRWGLEPCSPNRERLGRPRGTTLTQPARPIRRAAHISVRRFRPDGHLDSPPPPLDLSCSSCPAHPIPIPGDPAVSCFPSSPLSLGRSSSETPHLANAWPACRCCQSAVRIPPSGLCLYSFCAVSKYVRRCSQSSSPVA